VDGVSTNTEIDEEAISKGIAASSLN
jgi:hypothetical protein